MKSFSFTNILSFCDIPQNRIEDDILVEENWISTADFTNIAETLSFFLEF